MTPPHGRPSVAIKDHTLKMRGRFTHTAIPDVIVEQFQSTHRRCSNLVTPLRRLRPLLRFALSLKPPNEKVSCYAGD